MWYTLSVTLVLYASISSWVKDVPVMVSDASVLPLILVLQVCKPLKASAL